MDMESPLTSDPSAPDFVSVIIPTYNRAGTLDRAMRSVLAQTHRNLELIIADDASTDDTEAMVRNFGDDRVVYVRLPQNGGASAARNLGLATARGPLIAFQDSDDEWLLDKLERQIAALNAAGPEFGATFGVKLIYGHDENFVYGEGRTCVAPDRDRPVTDGDLTAQLVRGNLISPQTLLLRQDVARRVGGFDERLPCNNDWEYMLRLSKVTKISHTPVPVVVAYISSDSIHRKLRSKAQSMLVIMRKHRALFEAEPKAYAARMFSTGRYLYKLGRYKSAARCMQRAVRIAPGLPKPWIGLAQSRLSQVRLSS